MIQDKTFIIVYDGKVQESYSLKSIALDRAEVLAEDIKYVYVLDGEDDDRIIWSSDGCDYYGNPLEEESHLIPFGC